MEDGRPARHTHAFPDFYCCGVCVGWAGDGEACIPPNELDDPDEFGPDEFCCKGGADTCNAG